MSELSKRTARRPSTRAIVGSLRAPFDSLASLASRMAEAPESRTQPTRETRAATGFEDREGHRAPFASITRLSPEPEPVEQQLLGLRDDVPDVVPAPPPAVRVRFVVAARPHDDRRRCVPELAPEREPR